MRGVAECRAAAVTFAGAARQPDLRIDGNVVAGRGRDTCRRACSRGTVPSRSCRPFLAGYFATRRYRLPSARLSRRELSPCCRARRRSSSAESPLILEHPGGEVALGVHRMPIATPRASSRARGPRPGPSKIRGELTIAAWSGWASGTLMTSMRKCAEFGSSSGDALTQPDHLPRRPHERRPENVNIDVVRVLGIDEQRVGMRAAAGLNCRRRSSGARCR